MIRDWIDYAFGIFITVLFLSALYLVYMIATAPDFITKQLPDGRTVVCSNTTHQECDWENAQ
jgi:hypothetical protein